MEQIRKDIKGNDIKSLYLLYGEEDYLRQLLKNEIKQAVVGEQESMNYAYYEGKGVEAKEVISFADTMPFFAERRLVIVENCEMNKKAPDEWITYLSNIPQTTTIVIVQKEMDKRSRLFKTCKKYGYVADLNVQKDSFLLSWIKTWLNEHDRTMTDATIRYFLGRVSNNMGLLEKELEKLDSYDLENPEITREQVELLATETIENKIFAMIDYAVKADTVKAFQLYYDLLALKEAPMKILILLSRQINILLQIKDHNRLGHGNGEIAKAVGVAPFVVNKNIAVAKGISYAKLKYLLNLSVQLEEDIKTGKIKDQIAVELLLKECCKKA